MGHLGRGRASHFFYLFRVLGRFGHPWGQNGAKGLIMRLFFYYVGSDLIKKYLKMCPPVGNKAKHLSKSFLKIGEHFVLFFVVFGLISCAEYSIGGNGSSGGNILK